MHVSGDEELRAALRRAVGQVAREHLPGATGAGRLAGFVISLDWVDVGPAGGEHLIVDGRDPRVAARSLSQSLRGSGSGTGPGNRAR